MHDTELSDLSDDADYAASMQQVRIAFLSYIAFSVLY